jgi:hypothetical protein
MSFRAIAVWIAVAAAVVAAGWVFCRGVVRLEPGVADARDGAPEAVAVVAPAPNLASESVPSLAADRTPALPPSACVVKGSCRVDGEAATASAFEVTLALIDDRAAVHCATVTTPANEPFSIPIPWRANSGLVVEVAGEGFAGRRRVLAAIERDEVRDLGAITMYGGAVVTGNVRDQAGRPVSGLTLFLDAEPAVAIDALGAGDLNLAVLTTGASGQFVLERGLRRAIWRVRLRGSGVRSSTPERFEVLSEPVQLDIAVSFGPTIEGVVVDPEGRGVQGVQLEALTPEGGQRQSLLPCMTDEAGSFRLRGGDDAVSGALAHVGLIPSVSRRRKLVDGPLQAAWGSHGHRLVVDTAPLLELQLLDARTGHPVEEYAVSCEPGRAVVWRHSGQHPAGKAVVEPSGLGPWFLSVFVADLDVPILLHHPVSRADSSQPLVLSIERRAPLVVEVRGVQGPVVGATVQLCGLGGEAEPELLTSARALDTPRSIFCYTGTGPARFGEAVTGEDGLAWLRSPPEWPFAVWLVVMAPGHGTRLVRWDPGSPGRVLVQLEADAEVTGRLVATQPYEPGVFVVACLAGEQNSAVPGPVTGQAEVGPDGSFSLEVAPGLHRLFLTRKGAAAQQLGSLGDLRLRSGERLELGVLRHE